MVSVFSYQKSQFGHILEGLGMETVGIFYERLVYFMPFGIFGILRGALVYFPCFGMMYEEKSYNPGCKLERFFSFYVNHFLSRANPTTASYNTSDGNINNATSSLVHFLKQKYFLLP
jgi:hypothetical protein